MKLYFHQQDYGQSFARQLTNDPATNLDDKSNEQAVCHRTRSLDEHLFDEFWAELIAYTDPQGARRDKYESSRDYVHRYSHH